MTNTMSINEVAPDVMADLARVEMTVKPYGEVKKFLDETARETMYKIKDIINETLSFEGDEQ